MGHQYSDLHNLSDNLDLILSLIEWGECPGDGPSVYKWTHRSIDGVGRFYAVATTGFEKGRGHQCEIENKRFGIHNVSLNFLSECLIF